MPVVTPVEKGDAVAVAVATYPSRSGCMALRGQTGALTCLTLGCDDTVQYSCASLSATADPKGARPARFSYRRGRREDARVVVRSSGDSGLTVQFSGILRGCGQSVSRWRSSGPLVVPYPGPSLCGTGHTGPMWVSADSGVHGRSIRGCTVVPPGCGCCKLSDGIGCMHGALKAVSETAQ
jgi:hypothetical protein